LLFNEIQSKSPLPLISIVEAARNEAETLKVKKAGLIGTKFTMEASFYQDVFSKSGIQIVVPSPENIKIINEKLFSEIELGIFKDETRELMLGIIKNMIHSSNIDSLILGCTEFPIMFTEPKYFGIPFLNTTSIHVGEIVKKCIEP
jgi:aspartate racemase